MREQLDKIIADLREVKDFNELNISDDLLFDCSVRIMLSQNIQANKEKNMQKMNPNSNKEEPATEPQKSLLRTQGKSFSQDITKKQASDLIKSGFK